MRRYRPKGGATALRLTLSEIEPRTLMRLLAVSAAGLASVMSLIAFRTLPRTASVAGFAALALATIALSVRAWRTKDGRAPVPPLVALVLLTVWFVVALPPNAEDAPMRLVQVAVASLAATTALAAALHWRWTLRPVMAIGTAIVVAAQLTLIELAAAGPYRSALSAQTTRSDWNGLRPNAPVRNAAGEPDTTSLAWSAPATRDSALGLAFRPGSALNTLYPDNPRKYFRTGDFRRDIWEMSVMDGNTVSLEFPPTPGQVRIAIAAAERNVPEWHISLDQPHLHLDAGRTYELTFRARADQPRTIVAAVTEAHDPYELLGLYKTIELTREWRGFRLFATSPRTDGNARVHFAVGAHPASVDIADVEVRDASTDQPVTPKAARYPWVVNYRINGLGCRGPEIGEGRPDAPRLLLLGGGFVTGVGVHEEDAFATRLQALAGTTFADPSMQVMNCGFPGYGTREQLALYSRLSRYRPRMVLLFVDPDADRAHWEASQRALRDRRTSRAEQLSRTWGTITLLRRTRRTHDYARSVADIARLREQVTRDGGRLAVVLARTDASDEWGELRDALASGLKGSVPLIDLGDALADGRGWDMLVVHPTDPHPDEKAHAVAARLLAERLAPLWRAQAGGAATTP